MMEITKHDREPLKSEYRISEREIRAEVLEQMAARIKENAALVRTEPKSGFSPQLEKGETAVGLGLSPNYDVDLGGGITLGLQLQPDDLRGFMGDPDKFQNLLNNHLHIGYKDESAGDRNWAEAKLGEDGSVVIETKKNF